MKVNNSIIEGGIKMYIAENIRPPFGARYRLWVLNTPNLSENQRIKTMQIFWIGCKWRKG